MTTCEINELREEHSGDLGWLYAKGHHPDAVFLPACAEFARGLGIDPPLPANAVATRKWGRWVPVKGREIDYILRECAGPGRGAFPFTILDMEF